MARSNGSKPGWQAEEEEALGHAAFAIGQERVIVATMDESQDRIPAFDDCFFYHAMDIPGYGTTSGQWDLRRGVDAYLGNISFEGKRVLEIGPASGFLTFEMEKRGAQIACVEVPEDHGWDFVPYPTTRLQPIFGPRRDLMRRLRNSFRFAHAAHRSTATCQPADVYNLPQDLGLFDVAVMGSVLLHCHSPLQIIEQCACHARQLVIAERFFPDLEGMPICRLVPTDENFEWGTWWNFSTLFFSQFLEVLGFGSPQVIRHTQYHRGTPYELFTMTAKKKE